jgi:PBP1b-binding outer membrane lipoprotein LpoB
MLRFLIASLVIFSLIGCSGPRYQRGGGDSRIDIKAMSTGLDRVDLERALDDWYTEFSSSKFLGREGDGSQTLAVLRIDNDTSEHISSQLQTLISSVETRIVNDGDFQVVTNDNIAKSAIAAEMRRGDEVDQSTMAELGMQLGVQYFISGRVGDSAEKTADARRVQYFLFLRVTEVVTGRVMFQSQVDMTKQISG